jgi:nucleoside-diphosphate-sugar epimerase
MKILVTGSRGFIGSHLVKFLVEQGHTVIGVDLQNLSKANIDVHCIRSEVTYFNLDIVTEIDQIDALIQSVDVVYHLAASVGIPNYINDPVALFKTNVIGSYNIINSCLKYKKKIIFSSTSEIYGKNPELPWRENSDRVLGSTSTHRWNYSTSKATIEHLLYSMHGLLDFRIIRYFNVYGPGQNPIFLVSKSIHSALNGREILMYDNGTQTRCLTYITDAIEATYSVGIESTISSVYNIGNPEEVSVKEILNTVSQYFPGTKMLPVDTGVLYGDSYEDLDRRVPDIQLIREELSWTPRIGYQEGIAQFVKWARDNPEWLEANAR